MLDISKNREARKYSRKEIALRVLWATASPLFRFSPRICFGWRRFLLKLFGAKVGSNVHIYQSATIYMPWNLQIGDWSSIGEQALIYNLGQVTIGSKVTISQRAHICAGNHDYLQPELPLLKPPVKIENEVWVCADCFIGPGVTVGRGAVVGARGVAVSDVEPWTVVAGNPARFVKKRIMNENLQQK